MKMILNSFRLAFLAATLGLLGLAESTSAETIAVTVSPAVISNTYAGVITLQITGLTSGETVLVEQFYDSNTNGVVDAGEPLVGSFKVTDGQVTAFGGVRDTNIPGDNDGAANGSITTAFTFSGQAEFAQIVGRHLFRVSSPTANFASVVKPLDVSQTVYPQRITGQVLNGATGVGGAVVFVLTNSGGNNNKFISGVQTDSTGHFTITNATGGYALGATKAGVLFNFGAAPTVTVTAGQVASQNISVTSASANTISGKVTEIGSGVGIPAVQMFIQGKSSGFFSLIFTDSGGNYSTQVNPELCQIEMKGASLAYSGHLSFNNKPVLDATGGSVVTNFALAKETALIYGSVTSSTNSPLPGIDLFCNDNSQTYGMDVITDANGNYVLGVVAESWFIGPSSDGNPGLAGYTLTGGTNVNVAAGQAVQASFVAQVVTAYLTGQIQDGTGSPIPNASLVVQTYPFTNSAGVGSIGVNADGNGNFSVGVNAGTWNVAMDCVYAQANGYVNEAGPAYNSTVQNNQTNSMGILVFPKSTSTISGTVTDNHGNPLTNVIISAMQPIDANNFYFPGCVSTDGSGHYSIKVLGGSWTIMESANNYNNASSQTVSAGSTGVNFVLSPIVTISITTPSLGNGTQGSGYNAQLSATGGTSYMWNFDRGWLPSGLYLNPTNGSITGTPGESGSFNFKVRATDVSGGTTTMTYTLTIAGSGLTPGFTAPYFTNLTVASASQGGFQVVTVPGQTYAFENSTNLVNWVPIGNITANVTQTPLPPNRAILANPQLFLRGRIGRLFVTSLNFNFYAAGGSLSPSGGAAFGSSPVVLNSYRALLDIGGDPNSPDASTVTFTGPSGSGLSGTAADTQNSFISNEDSEYESIAVNGASPTIAGTWSFNDGGTTNFSITVPDPQTGSRLIIPVPTANVSGGILQSVTWTYKDAATLQTSTTVPPPYMIQIQLQIDALVNSTTSRVYNSPQLPPSTTQNTLSTSITWANVRTIYMAYQDTLGNSYVISFNVQAP